MKPQKLFFIFALFASIILLGTAVSSALDIYIITRTTGKNAEKTEKKEKLVAPEEPLIQRIYEDYSARGIQNEIQEAREKLPPARVSDTGPSRSPFEETVVERIQKEQEET